MKLYTLILTSLFLVYSQTGFGQVQPTDPSHPGSADYQYDLQIKNHRINGRKVTVYLPISGPVNSVPVIVFGHGQALDESHYHLSFEHLARKGVAVIHPQYDNGFFDQDWQRMAADYHTLTGEILQLYTGEIDPAQVIYSGHSKGAYVALMAAGDSKNTNKPQAAVLFAPAGYDENYLAHLPRPMPLTLIWGDQDSIISRSSVWEIYEKAPSNYKQFIEVQSYSSLAADHFFPLSKSTFLGGKNGVSAFHYYGVWKWLIGAVQDVVQKSLVTNPFIYGNQADSTGVTGKQHKITRN